MCDASYIRNESKPTWDRSDVLLHYTGDLAGDWLRIKPLMVQ